VINAIADLLVVELREVISDRKVKKLIGDRGITNLLGR